MIDQDTQRIAEDQQEDRIGKYGGWGRPATEKDICPRCFSQGCLKYLPGFATAADNACVNCSYHEFIQY